MNEKLITSVFNQYKSTQVKSIDKLNCGDVNNTYKIITDNEIYIAKIIDVDSYFKFYHLQKNELILSLNFSEELATVANQKKIPTVSAFPFGTNRYIEISNSILLIYPYVQGNILPLDAMQDAHIKAIAELLARLHTLSYDDSLKKLANRRYDVVKGMAKQLLHEKKWQQATPLFRLGEFQYLQKVMNEVSDAINLHCDSFINSLEISLDILICHNDVKPKNVLWNESSPTIIDWEGAGNMPRMVDYLDTMLSWCTRIENGELHLDVKKKDLFDKTYQQITSKSEVSNDVINLVIVKWIAWLVFCLSKVNANFDVKKQIPLIDYSLNYIHLILKNYDSLGR